MIEQHQQKIEAAGNYAIGILGVTIGLQDITNLFQCIGVVAGALLVCLQLYRQLRK